MVATKSDVLRVIERHGASIASLGVRRLGLFGSFVRGEPRTESDVDMLVEFDPSQKTFDNYMELSFLLEELLERLVELVTTEALSPHICPRILQEVEYVNLASVSAR